jgi:hypothetical protein
VVHPGMPVSVTAVASDADTPTQALTFTLVRDTPPGATLDSETGAFSWSGTSDQSQRTYHIGVQVTDDGSPPLTDTLIFEIRVVPLAITRLEQYQQSGSWNLTFNSAPGTIYRLQGKERLEDTWRDLYRIPTSPLPPLREAGIYDNPQGAAQRFYRIRHE